jgi:hypothetical protein
MRTLTQQLDARYWERRSEVNRETTHQSHKSDKGSDKAKPSQQHSDKKPNPFQPKASSSNNRPAPPRRDPEKFDKDGKLTPKERQRRMDNHLCLVCGATGHMARECPRAKPPPPAPKPKARASKTNESKSSAKSEAKSASEEPKN